MITTLRELFIPLGTYLSGALAVAVLFGALWLISLWRRDASIVDIFWGLGFVLIAIVSLFSVPTFGEAIIGMATLITLWGVRLATHLFLRWRKEGQKDYRYQKMRAYHGRHFWWRSLFTVFVLQGVLMWLVAVPYMASVQTGGAIAVPLGTLAGLLIALAGLTIETIADIQLSRFRANPTPGGILMTGLWRYSRHPNYFGDTLFWWGIWIAVVATTPALVWTIFAPIVMNVLLVRISGAVMLERRLRKKPGYTDYQASTNRFVPHLFPK